MKAIETTYRGYRFRSRLEARWAVFFDTLRVKWEYEKEGYDLEGMYYLPDFWMPDQDCWIEIKGNDPSDDELEKVRRLARLTGKTVYIFSGPIPDNNSLSCFTGNSAEKISPASENECFWDNQHCWCVCPWCGKIGIEYQGRGARICGYNKHDPENNNDKCYTHDDLLLLAAYNEARNARFGKGGRG